MKKKLILGMILLALTFNQFSFVSFADETDDAISEMREREAETQAAISNLAKTEQEYKETERSLKAKKKELDVQKKRVEEKSFQLMGSAILATMRRRCFRSSLTIESLENSSRKTKNLTNLLKAFRHLRLY